MSIISKGGKNAKNYIQEGTPTLDQTTRVQFRIVDTEFLIRLIMQSRIEGKDVDVCSSVLGKIKKVHEALVKKTFEVG
tara:strand:+ start:171 stop:404 length:234 start_codon:yes stop_codon:yes gene_type:complete